MDLLAIVKEAVEWVDERRSVRLPAGMTGSGLNYGIPFTLERSPLYVAGRVYTQLPLDYLTPETMALVRRLAEYYLR